MKSYTSLLSILVLFISSFAYSGNKHSTIRKPAHLSDIPSPESRIPTTGTVYLNLNQATTGPGYVDIPVSFTSSDQIVSLDFLIKFNELALSYQSIVNQAPYLRDALANYSNSDKSLRFTSNSATTYLNNTTIISIRFNILTGTVNNSDFFGMKAYLNGDPVSLQAIGNINKYIIEPTTGPCTDPSFCLPITAVDSVRDVIGYDIVLNYNPAKVHATGNITIYNALINAGYASYVVNNDAVNGILNIAVYLNTSAPANTSFTGTGKLICVEFTKDPSLLAVDTVFFSVPSLQESYVNGVTSKLVHPDVYVNTKSNLYKGSLKFWTDNSPIKYDSLNPGAYLITNIYGTDSSCMNKSATAIQPDLNGYFSYNILNGTSIMIERDILSATDVQPVINGFDASLAYKVVLGDTSFIPNIYQAIALDVNTDGAISAGDISQINQRSVKTIDEFKQKWNYNSNGTSNGEPSKDWLFVNSVLLTNPAYKISTTYPSSDGKGFSKSKIPLVPFCLHLPLSPYPTACSIYEETPYTGILLGDINGNYDAIPADGQLKRETANGTIYLNLDQAKITEGYIDIPVSFVSMEKITSLDFATTFNEHVLRFEKIVYSSPNLRDALANYAHDDKTLRFTSNSGQLYSPDQTVVSIRFSTLNTKINTADFSKLAGYLNGNKVKTEIIGSTVTSIPVNSANTGVQVYPNPANRIIHVLSPEKAHVELMDLEGKHIVLSIMVKENEKKEINTGNIANGMYLLKVYNEHFMNTQRIEINNN